jgi:glyoxylase-like metal-dependent hydrolase (beta-lactamase superfamily II)
MAHNPLPLYYRSYESPILGIEAPFVGCHFEFVDGEQQIVPGVSVFPSPGHSVGHQCVVVETSSGDAVFVGDAIFNLKNMEPNMEEKWRYWVPARFVNSVDGWKSIEEIDKRSDYILATHDPTLLDHQVYPYDGMPVRQRRQTVAGTSFYFGGI